MKKISFSFTWLLLLLTLPIANAFAQEDLASKQFANEVEAEETSTFSQAQHVEIVKPVNARDLKASKSTSTVLEEAYSYVNEKGEVVQVTTLRLSQSDRGKSFDISIDPNTNEYVVEESRNFTVSSEPLSLAPLSTTREYFMGATYPI